VSRIAVIITKNEYVRNYLQTHAFESLSKNNEIHLFIKPHLEDYIDSHDIFESISEFPDFKKDVTGQLLFDLSMIKYKSLSSSFRYRIKRKFPSTSWQLQYLKSHPLPSIKTRSETNIKTAKRWNKKVILFIKISKLVRLLTLYVLGKLLKVTYFALALPPFFKVSKFVIIRYLASESYKLEFLLNFDAVLIPSSAYEPYVPTLLRFTNRNSIPTLLLIDNWDNLSSKSILWEKPSLLACWGMQSIEHAVRIQGLARDQCIAIGTPRIDPYFKLRDHDLNSFFDFQYILFLGSSVPYDEAGFLLKLDDEIYRNPEIYGDIRILYRPHPLRGGWEVIDRMKLKRTLIDPDLSNAISSGSIRWNRNAKLPPLKNYPALLQNCLFAVTGLTSMIFEASIFGKECHALAFEEEDNITNPKRMLEEYVHFWGIEKLPNLHLHNSHELALEKIRNSVQNPTQIKRPDIDKQVSYFLHFDTNLYSERLCMLVEQRLINIKN